MFVWSVEGDRGGNHSNFSVPEVEAGVSTPSGFLLNTTVQIVYQVTSLNCSRDTNITRLEPHVNSTTSRTLTPRARVTQYLDGYLSEGDYNYYINIVDPLRFALHGITTPVLLLTIFAFCRDKKKTTSSKFIIFLNLFELICNLANLILFIFIYTVGNTDRLTVLWTLISNVIIVSCRRVVYVINLFLSIQRTVAVTVPLKYRSSAVLQGGRAVFIAVPCVTFTFHAYLIPIYSVIEVKAGVFAQSTTQIYKDNLELFETLSNFGKTAFSYVPLALSLLANVVLLLLVRGLREKSKAIQANTEASRRPRRDRQMTAMIVVSTLAYTVLSLPANINQIVSYYSYTYGMGLRDNYLYLLLRRAVNVSQTVGDLTNFLIYVCLSKSFRLQMLQAVFPQRYSSPRPDISRHQHETRTENVTLSSQNIGSLPE
ncbi:uncharacterized protein LOC131936960 [Physella acuta]|uniref:uncharacterized protein LOC131936960 n=1 Tax=Physella acuta TaxID=109671 RepID=UPI0027DC5C03|nr:uncharacterized protein LOC131936960 [Physella acuta]